MRMTNEQVFKDVRFLSVTALTRYLSYKFEMDEHLQEVYLQGEISNFKISGRHYYFSLKDENAEISATMFAPYNQALKFMPKDGMMVQVMGKVQIYEKRGIYSINVRKMAEAGIGLLYQQFLDLKDQLQKEGLFDPAKKLPLPEYPKSIAIITASTGEAINDMITTFSRRLTFAKITLYPALVQGRDAPADLIRALKEVYASNKHDCLIIGRGGGSFEDLSCFNDEALARTLFASPIPTVSAVGHEGDVTICDFVASQRAATPTAAAILLSTSREDVVNHVNHLQQRLLQAAVSGVEKKQSLWQKLAGSYGLANFGELLQGITRQYEALNHRLLTSSPLYKMAETNKHLIQYRNRLDVAIQNRLEMAALNLTSSTRRLRKEIIIERIKRYDQQIESFSQTIKTKIASQLENSEKQLNALIEKTIILNPLNLMKKGYSIVYQNEKVKSSVSELDFRFPIKVRMVDGHVDANILRIVKDDN